MGDATFAAYDAELRRRAEDLPLVYELFVVDSAFFPSSGAQNPALTIGAQALRVAAESEWDAVA